MIKAVESDGDRATVSNAHNSANSRVWIGNCSECGLRISSFEEACEALGSIYHNYCFVCCCCRRSLLGKIFYKDQSKAYCEEDYLYCGFQRSTEKCCMCEHITTDLLLIALGRSYHPGCFRCTVCNECLDDMPFSTDENGALYCMKDYALIHSPRCAKCGMPILPSSEGSNEIKRVCALNKEFHVDCFKCEDCHCKLGDDAQSTPCYPIIETSKHQDMGSLSIASNNNNNAVHLLCLGCHLNRVGVSAK